MTQEELLKTRKEMLKAEFIKIIEMSDSAEQAAHYITEAVFGAIDIAAKSKDNPNSNRGQA